MIEHVDQDLRGRLRSLPVFAAPMPAFDPAQAPSSPEPMFVEWLEEAIAAGVPEPHAMTLSTVDSQGDPDARALILKDVDESGWRFASSALSPKGRQLSVRPTAALTLYWPQQGRQVRVRGPVVEADPAESADDFLARSARARAETLLGRQSVVREDDGEADPVQGEVTAVAPAWRVYVVVPSVVEFFQGAASRDHTRVRYRRSSSEEGTPWVTEVLWP